MMYFKILFRNIKSKILLLLTLITLILSIFICVNYEYFLQLYYSNIYGLVGMIFIIMNQSLNYHLHQNVYVQVRHSSEESIIKETVIEDIIVIVIYVSLITVVANILTVVFNAWNFYKLMQYMILMMVWGIFYTSVKNFVYIVSDDYNFSTIVVSIMIVLLWILDARTTLVYSNLLTSIFALFGSIFILIVILLVLKRKQCGKQG